MTSIDLTSRGVELRDFPGWPGWVFKVNIDWRTGHVREDGFHETRPPGDRRKPPSKRPDVLKRIIQAAEAQCGHGTGFATVDLVVASRPNPRGTHNTAERAETIAMVYGAALAQGLAPLKTISAAYGFAIDTSGEIDEYCTTVERWVSEARKFGFLAEYDDPEQHAPRRWPGGGGHPLEPRSPRSMLAEPKREGPHAGRILTFHYRPLPPLSVNAARDEITNVEIVGKWSDGKPVENIPTLRSVTLTETVVTHMNRLNAKFEKLYPGARIRSTFASPDHRTETPGRLEGTSVRND